VAYVAFAALRATEGSALAFASLLLAPVALAFTWRATARELGASSPDDAVAQVCARLAATGLCALAAAATGPDRSTFVALSNAAAAVAALSGLVAIARLPALGGALPRSAEGRRLEPAAFAAMLWTVAVALPAARELAPNRFGTLDRSIVDFITALTALATLGIGIAATARVHALRKLELGVADRASAALFAASTALVIALATSLLGIAPPERTLPIAAALAGAAATTAAATEDASRAIARLRLVLATTALIGPLTLALAIVARTRPDRSSLVVLAACLLTAIATSLAPRLAKRLAGDAERWRAALDVATGAAMSPDPDTAIEGALMAMRTAAGAGATTSAALYRVAPPERVTVDRAGYARIERARLPAGLIPFAKDEPDGVLRVNVAHAVEVRAPAMREVAAWMDERGYAAAAIVRDGNEAIGVLAIPSTTWTSPGSLDEVRALRVLADRLAAVVSVSAMLARARERDMTARATLETQGSDLSALRTRALAGDDRRVAFASLLARAARSAAYSPAARATIDRLEHLGESDVPVVLVTPPGVDAIAWAAIVHLASKRRGGPLVIIEGALPIDHAIERWRDTATSPLEAARDGTLVVLDAHALPHPVQAYLAAAFEGIAGLVISTPRTTDALVATGAIDERFADKLGDRAVALPPLRARSEDLRALTIEHLARIGARLGHALGVTPRGLQALLEHDFPGNDLELADLLLRASIFATAGATATTGVSIDVAHLAAAGLAISKQAQSTSLIADPAERPRRRRRAQGM
jgi:hypothetical protein